ncbi:MAG: heavy metal translocating P-type ATPase [Arachnia sp.]
MSKECCGSDEPDQVLTKKRTEMTRPTTKPPTLPVEIPGGDACCGPDPTSTPTNGVDGLHFRAPWWRDVSLLPSAISGVFLVAGYFTGWLGAPLLAVILQWIALLAGAYTFVPGSIRRLVRGRIGVGLLMTMAAIGAVLLGHVAEAAALAFLFSLAEALEERAMVRAKEGLRALLSLIPDSVRIASADGDTEIPAADVRTSDVLIVGAGERVATDGVVVAGRSSLDTSAVTGESIPVEVETGDHVIAGSVNGSATLRIEATADGRDNSLTQIVTLVEQAHTRKGQRARLADRIARPLVPLVLITAALIVLFGFIVGDPGLWTERALVVLVAASPCALAIAVPVTVISAIGSASKFGVVIKSGEAFEQFGTIRTVALDKTGTLTQNKPTVVAVAPAPGVTREELLEWAASVEATSSHPLASAITLAAPGTTPAIDVVETAGHGVTGQVGGQSVRVGDVRWLDPGALAGAAETMATQGATVVVVETDGHVVGLIGVRDEIRPEAAEMVSMLHSQGIATIMLTGDHAITSRAIAHEAGIADIRAEQLPKDKADAIATLVASRATAMVGDGINDAPALATATVGIAMGLQGSAAAVESADIAFTGHDLRLIPEALAHARRGRRIMTANIAFALAIIIALFPLALFGVLGLAGVVLVHEAAEVIIILNGLRAARHPIALRQLTTAPHPEPALV